MTLEQKPAKGTSLTEALTVDRHASSAKFLRSYNQKSEDCPDGSIENQRPNRAVRLAEKRCSRSAKSSVRLKSRPKFKPSAERITTRETKSRGRPRHNRSRHPRTTMPREPGNKPRGRATCLAYHGRWRRPSRETTSRVRPRIHRPIFIRPTTAADHESVRPRPFRSY
ncbi:unnamed protein product [Microthlaspi erraticum]|uniref:Uncharacterized protein n=1 Tax=Microthlaspi erraticum TaxID=1685480 RepID=A0A6D2IAN6_9BRAS|nr:unnamed protein product [Microthlaspi erraticum]